MSSVPTERNELAELIGPFWTARRVCAALGLSPDALDIRRADGTVLALSSADGVVVYPVSQFQRHPDGTTEVRPALIPVLQALHAYDPWAVAVLLHTPAPELDGTTPLDWLGAGGDQAPLTRLAEAVAWEWSAGSLS